MDPAITINRLQLKRARGSEDAVAQQLSLADWPGSESEYLFIRRVQVTSPPHEVGHRASRRAAELAASARDGHSVGAEEAGAVRFASLVEVLTRLSVDLVRGRASELWFWWSFQDLFSLARGEALQRLWSRSPIELPAVTERLGQQGALKECWNSLEAPHALALGQQLLRRFSTPSPGMPAASAPPPTPPPGPLNSDADRNSARLHAVAVSLPQSYHQRWRPVLAGLSPEHPRVELAALLILQSWRPTWLQAARVLGTDGPGTSSKHSSGPLAVVSSVARALLGTESAAGVSATETGVPAVPTKPSVSATASAAGTLREPAEAQHPVAAPAFTAGGQSLQVGEAPSLDTVEGAAEGAARISVSPSSLPAAPEAVQLPRAPQPFPQSASTSSTSMPSAVQPEAWLTQRGGLFYLINFLSSTEAQTLLCSSPEALAFPSGWAWLYDFCIASDFAPDPPLLDFLTTAAELPDPSALTSLQPLPQREALLSLARTRYASRGVWSPALFNLAARVERRTPYVDVHFSLADVRLEVRTAGLDVDPGFVRWLGCVVRFHYGTAPLGICSTGSQT